MKATKYSSTEEWILNELSEGRIADLTEFSALNNSRNISSDFIEDLLTGNIKNYSIGYRGIRIANGIVKDKIELRNSLIEYEVQLTNFNFDEDIDFSETTIKRNIVLRRNLFKGRVNFSGTTATSISFENSHFHKGMDFSHAKLSGTLEANETQFISKENQYSVSLNGGAFNGILIRGSVFNGAADFIRVKCYLDLDLKNTKFHNKNSKIDFSGITVEGNVYLDGIQAKNTLYFRSSNIFSLQMYGSTYNYNDPNIYELNFSFASFDTEVEIIDANINILNLEYAVFSRSVIFHKINVIDKAIFSNSYYDFLALDNVKLPKGGNTILAGMKFRSISPTSNIIPNDESWGELIDIIEYAKYSPESYTALEHFFLKTGLKDKSDNIFIKNKQRERRERLNGGKWLGSFALDVLVRHGRNPGLVFIWGFIIIAIGYIVFHSQEVMTLQNTSLVAQVYSPFWYSLDLFIPFIDLHAANVWIPKESHAYMVVYSHIHKMLGWILVPIGLAALTGFIK